MRWLPVHIHIPQRQVLLATLVQRWWWWIRSLGRLKWITTRWLMLSLSVQKWLFPLIWPVSCVTMIRYLRWWRVRNISLSQLMIFRMHMAEWLWWLMPLMHLEQDVMERCVARLLTLHHSHSMRWKTWLRLKVVRWLGWTVRGWTTIHCISSFNC